MARAAAADPALAARLAAAKAAGSALRVDPRTFLLTPERKAVVLESPSLEAAASALGVARCTLSDAVRADPELVAAIAARRQAERDAVREAAPPKPRKQRDPESFDSRPLVRGDQVETAILAAAQAVMATFPGVDSRGPRWAGGEYWPRLRAAFHVLPEAARREAIVRLVLEESERLEQDHGLQWRPAERHQGQAPRGGGHDH